MLCELHIQDFTIIDQLDLHFDSGMSVFTGETGAGKSILIDALLLTLGGRASSHSVRQGSKRCQISAVFSLKKNPKAQAWLQGLALDLDDEQCLLRRTVNKEGRSQAFVNNQPVLLKQLHTLAQMLITIHGQHEQQALLNKDFQRQLVDDFAGHHSVLSECRSLYQQWQEKKHALSALQHPERSQTAERDFLQFQLSELDQLHLQENEVETLHAHYKKLANSEEILNKTQTTIRLIEQQQLPLIVQQLHELTTLDPSLMAAAECLDSAQIQFDEATAEINQFIATIDLDGEQLQTVNNRLEKLHDIARKHHVEPEHLLAVEQHLREQLTQLAHNAQRILDLEQDLSDLAEQYQIITKQLSASRQKAAKTLSLAVNQSLHQLAMTHANFMIQIDSKGHDSLHPDGDDDLAFYIQTNPGQPAHLLSQVASGGELSRIALAIDVITAQSHAIPALIFDEVDTGIGGATSEIIGQLLRELGERSQVFAVTHLAQVAALAHQHFYVNKNSDKSATTTTVTQLSREERIREIARMVSGSQITENTLKHASELIALGVNTQEVLDGGKCEGK